MADFVPESHTDLTDIGVRTHPQIDSDLDALIAAAFGGVTWERFTVALSPGHLAQELLPSVIRIDLPVGKTFVDSRVVIGTVDGRTMPEGAGWQRAADNLAIEVHVPTDPLKRARYLAAPVRYDIIWSR